MDDQSPPHAGHFFRMSWAPSKDLPLMRRSRTKWHLGLLQIKKRSIGQPPLGLGPGRSTPEHLSRQSSSYTYSSYLATNHTGNSPSPLNRGIGWDSLRGVEGELDASTPIARFVELATC